MKRSRANGWGAFAATMLFVAGAVNIVQGAVALFTPEYFVAAEGEILVFDFALWGLVLGTWGIVLVLGGLALLAGRMWARVLAVVVAAVNAFAQLAFVESYPVWSLVAVAVDLLIVYAVTAGWPDRERGGGDAYEAGRADARGAAPGREQEGAGTEGHTGPVADGERAYGGASTQQARQGATERPPGTRPGRHEQPMG
ncbi:DUF7144 family membrane protein [Streptomonospora salina]|uniref:DUF7144 domain-containing protein n=1 Tax=Streptomonospora salina TaxID=104205 RepID=A0A841EG69_9ACTN|nr:hypothetical protein [Streptomonospora salina]MBB6001294.1 hypothetical protein [Streptomonospora salina]